MTMYIFYHSGPSWTFDLIKKKLPKVVKKTTKCKIFLNIIGIWINHKNLQYQTLQPFRTFTLSVNSTNWHHGEGHITRDSSPLLVQYFRGWPIVEPWLSTFQNGWSAFTLSCSRSTTPYILYPRDCPIPMSTHARKIARAVSPSPSYYQNGFDHWASVAEYWPTVPPTFVCYFLALYSVLQTPSLLDQSLLAVWSTSLPGVTIPLPSSSVI